MEEDKKEIQEQKNGKVVYLILFIIFIVVLIPFISIASQSTENLNKSKHEAKLVEEGKTKTQDEVINEIIEILKNKDKDKMKSYLSENFKYYDNDNKEYKYADNFLKDLDIYFTSYEIEQRGNDIKDEVTYRIYWNVVEQNKENGVKQGERGYCLQTLTIMLKRVVKQDEITYQIEKIILKKD